ncbi:DUF2523 domain-containing protein [Rheinheimera sp. MMS21-TC3]|uniref:DUF2523 domain-containing protein n=1 Tax=Rheinheimera sp. MMS21-TC3 TaxID=3072790 RepID=UPI0028C4E185|nr:DUF2523 domain-containing protein [Rheinheimera sp. MMS21-TC3]WNO61091.1 DUF2523 domain-containing protein [Rheinheimera sp. MMS21-TC3]
MPLIAWLGAALSTLFLSWRVWIIAFLATSLGPYIINLLVGAGVGYVTYELGTFALDQVFNEVKSALSGVSADLLTFVSIAKIDEAMSILFGGLAARLALSGFSSVTSAGKRRAPTLGSDG